MQLLSTIAEACKVRGADKARPHVSTYAVLPLSRSSGLIEWVPGTRPLFDLYRDAVWSRGLSKAIADRQKQLGVTEPASKGDHQAAGASSKKDKKKDKKAAAAAQGGAQGLKGHASGGPAGGENVHF